MDNQFIKPNGTYTISLDSGRKLGFAEFGDPEGLPVFWFHGTPGAKLQVPHSARQHAVDNQFRIISVERPGIGSSTPHLYNRILDWTDDINELVEELALPHFGLIGLSGGGPYVLACAYRFPEQVLGAAVFGGVAPTLGEDAPEGGLTRKALKAESFLTRNHRWLGKILTRSIQIAHPVADPILDLLVKYVKIHETVMLARPEIRHMFLEDILVGSKQNLHSILYDIILFARHWGFSNTQIAVPVHFWQGTADPLVPVEHAEHLARIIPNAKISLRAAEGHLAGLDNAVDALNFIRAQAPDYCNEALMMKDVYLN